MLVPTCVMRMRPVKRAKRTWLKALPGPLSTAKKGPRSMGRSTEAMSTPTHNRHDG